MEVKGKYIFFCAEQKKEIQTWLKHHNDDKILIFGVNYCLDVVNEE